MVEPCLICDEVRTERLEFPVQSTVNQRDQKRIVSSMRISGALVRDARAHRGHC